MTMIYGLSREDNLIMLIEDAIYDNGYLERATVDNKLDLLESLIVAREEVSPLNKVRVRRAIRVLKDSIISETRELN